MFSKWGSSSYKIIFLMKRDSYLNDLYPLRVDPHLPKMLLLFALIISF